MYKYIGQTDKTHVTLTTTLTEDVSSFEEEEDGHTHQGHSSTQTQMEDKDRDIHRDIHRQVTVPSEMPTPTEMKRIYNLAIKTARFSQRPEDCLNLLMYVNMGICEYVNMWICG